MTIDFIAKVLIAGSVLLTLPFKSLAWTVSENVVRLSDEKMLISKSTAPETNPDDKNDHSELKSKTKVVATTAKEPEKETSSFSKKDASLSSEEDAMNNLRRAQLLIKKRDYPQAEKYLINTLNRVPNHHASRVELASLYLKENQLEESENLLLEGFKYDENNADFLRLMAMIHDKKEEPEKALALLVKVKESRRQDTNYIAFLGHIYQEMGQYGLARQQYYRLLQLEPRNSMWLLGVSIALDAEGQKEAALEGYHRLAREGNIEPKILQYVQTRINNLKG